MIETGFVARIVGIDMIIDKVYNNNIVQLIGENKEEIIAMGRGIGFQKKPGQSIDDTQVEKWFVPQNQKVSDDISTVYSDLSEQEVEAVLAIIQLGQKELEMTFDAALYIALADHIHYTIERIQDGFSINNPLSWEIRKFYPKEYTVGQKALDIIKDKLNINLPSDEGSSIALHLINAQKDSGMVEKN
ncbi:beta-glucoside operon transcriptional antiterminator [Streptococcus urinalis]|uniref:PRD domain protein n=1 Tax=Streptococcus urinalis 2285-97 TaxID=764291 RepID=G5KFQ2_9STRE|nr:PRD domain protein [Streptococcus urinalis 2285-97]VEF31926.1 beta-glucoside operon transcriptional antiterminator [Streptococcus urinalis]